MQSPFITAASVAPPTGRRVRRQLAGAGW